MQEASTATDYEKDLEANLLDLLGRIKSGSYFAPPVQWHNYSGLTLQFGIRNLIGKRPQFRWNWHAFQEVRVSSPHSTIECTLGDNVRPGRQGVPSGFQRLFKGHTFRFDTDNILALGLELQEMSGFVPIAVLLKQDGIFTVINRHKVFAPEIGEIEACGVWTCREPHEIRSRQPNSIVIPPHLEISGLGLFPVELLCIVA